MSEWQDIATAPRRGMRRVLVYDGQSVDVAWFRRGWWRNEINLFTPTHWMPLPDPPGMAATTKGVR